MFVFNQVLCFLLCLVCSIFLESRPGLNTGLQKKKAKLQNTGIDTSASLFSRIAFSNTDVIHSITNISLLLEI